MPTISGYYELFGYVKMYVNTNQWEALEAAEDPVVNYFRRH